tara:strand:+ start:394 stop:1122 length:729 start_codon:yes stop_codon:yes gene_type:complete
VKALITFGCSWTRGVGSWYDEELSHEDFLKCSKILSKDENCFRTVLAKRHAYENINLSASASSNAKQFRLAEEYFNKDDYKKFDKVIVLWGITSTARIEIWSNKKKKYHSLFLNNNGKINNIIREEHYDHEVELNRLSEQILHWDKYFSMIGVENYWFDTFNHHDYSYKSSNMIWVDDNSRDILSKLCGEYINDTYHLSVRKRDSNRIRILEKNNLVNPHSLHPNKRCHMLIADMLDKQILW